MEHFVLNIRKLIQYFYLLDINIEHLRTIKDINFVFLLIDFLFKFYKNTE